MKYFSYEELSKSNTAKRFKIDNRPNDDIKSQLKSLVENILDPLREAWGNPIIVDSGYRCPELNKRVGGAKNSQHMYGQAADIRTVSDKPEENKRLLRLLLSLNLPFDKCISEYVNSKGEPSWIHISYSPMKRKQKWTCRNGKYYSGINV
jgi:zinc D-Ala-D-Ala carboxypeptidase